MTLSPTELHELGALAIRAATEAGRMVAQSRPVDVQHKESGDSLASQVVTEVDRHSEAMILDVLGPTLERFELGLLTEEQDDDGGRLTAEYFWCIDPIDGTLPFIEGTPGYAVSIALVRSDGVPMVGVVYDPVTATTFHAVAGAGAFRDGEPWRAPASIEAASDATEVANKVVLSVFADRSFLDLDDHDRLVAGLEVIARNRGLAGVELHVRDGAVMNACGVLANAPACYFKQPKGKGGGCLWDYAATACLFHECNAVASDIHGASLDLNRSDSTFMSHRGVLFASDSDLAAQIRTLAGGTSE